MSTSAAGVTPISSTVPTSRVRTLPDHDASPLLSGASPAPGGPPHWGVYLHPSVFRVEATGRDILYNLYCNGTLRYYYHLLKATSSVVTPNTTANGSSGDVVGNGTDSSTTATTSPPTTPTPKENASDAARASPPAPNTNSSYSALPDPALTQRLVQRCLRQSIPQIVSFRYTVHTAHHVAGASGTATTASSQVRRSDGGASSGPSVTSRHAIPTDQLVGQMRSSRLNSIEALLPNRSPFPPIPIQRTLFPLSAEQEQARDATVCALIGEPVCHQAALSLEHQLHEARIGQRHQSRLFTFRAADPVREPMNVYNGSVLDLVMGGGEVTGLYHSPLISGLEVALASMTVGETAGFFINAPQTYAFSAPDLDLVVPGTPAPAATASTAAADPATAYNDVVPELVRRGADRVLYYEIRLLRRAPAIFAFPPCRGLTLYSVPPMSVERAHRQHAPMPLSGPDTHLRAQRGHDVESLLRLRVAAGCNPYNFFLFTNLTRVGRELPLATFCAVDVQACRRELESAPLAAGDNNNNGDDADHKNESSEERELRRLHAQQLCEAEAAIQVALLGKPELTTAAANRAFAMAVSMTMGSTTLFDAPAVQKDDATRRGNSTGGNNNNNNNNNNNTPTATTRTRPPRAESGESLPSTSLGSLNTSPSFSPSRPSTVTEESFETHGLLTHTLEAAMISFGYSTTAAALRDAVLTALSAPNSPGMSPTVAPHRPTSSSSLPAQSSSSTVPATGPATDPWIPVTNVAHLHGTPPPQNAPVTTVPSQMSPLPQLSPGQSQALITLAAEHGALLRNKSPRHVLAAEYERWLTDACHYLDSRFLPCPRGAALVQLRLSRYEPLTEQFHDLLRPDDDEDEAGDEEEEEDGNEAAGSAVGTGDARPTATTTTGTMISPVCSLAIPCWLSLALTQQLHRSASAEPTTTTTTTTTTAAADATQPRRETTVLMTPPSERDFCVSSVRVRSPIGLPMDQSNEEAFMINLLHQLRADTVASFESCRDHLREQLDELATASADALELGAEEEEATNSAPGRSSTTPTTVAPPPNAATPRPSAATAAAAAPSAGAATTTTTTTTVSHKPHPHGSEAILAAFPCEERIPTMGGSVTSRLSADASATGTLHAAAASTTTTTTASAAAGLCAATPSCQPSSIPNMEEEYHLESRIISPTPALRKRHFFFLNPKTSLGQVRALLSRVCTLLHIYDARNPYRRGATRVWRSSLSSSTTSRASARPSRHYSALADADEFVTTPTTGLGVSNRPYSSPLAGASVASAQAWQTHSTGSGDGPGHRGAADGHGAPPPPHPALAGWGALETQCAKLATRLDKVREIPEHETMVDQLLLGPTVCTQTNIAGAAPNTANTTTGTASGPAATEGDPVRTWANVLDCATFFAADECGKLLPEQREKAVLRRCLFKVFELAYLAIVLLTFGTEESQLRPSWFLARGGYAPYFSKAVAPTVSSLQPELSVRLDDNMDISAALQGKNLNFESDPLSTTVPSGPECAREPVPWRRCDSMSMSMSMSIPIARGRSAESSSTRFPSRGASTADLLAASMAASTCLTSSAAATRIASDNSKRRRYQYLAECYQYVALTFWELLVPYLLTPSAMLQRDDDGGGDPVLRPISYTSSTTRKTPIANMLCECGLDAVTYALLYDPHEASLWSLRARFHTQQGLLDEAQRDLEIAQRLTTAEKTEETRLMRRQNRTAAATSANVASPSAPELPGPSASMVDEEAVLDILEERLMQLEEQEEQLKALRTATARELKTSQ